MAGVGGEVDNVAVDEGGCVDAFEVEVVGFEGEAPDFGGGTAVEADGRELAGVVLNEHEVARAYRGGPAVRAAEAACAADGDDGERHERERERAAEDVPGVLVSTVMFTTGVLPRGIFTTGTFTAGMFHVKHRLECSRPLFHVKHRGERSASSAGVIRRGADPLFVMFHVKHSLARAHVNGRSRLSGGEERGRGRGRLPGGSGRSVGARASCRGVRRGFRSPPVRSASRWARSDSFCRRVARAAGGRHGL